MKTIWATVDFGNVKVTQPWPHLTDEVGNDSEIHDFVSVLAVGERKQLVIQLDKNAVYSNGESPCYLGALHIKDAVILP
jgi:hypothetical protein